MMLVIADRDPIKAVEYLIEHTDKKFCFKQLMQLGHLVCSANISDVYKRIPKAIAIQKWIKHNPSWVYLYYKELYLWCVDNLNMQESTEDRLDQVLLDLREFRRSNKYREIDTAILRYQKGYLTIYDTNTELPIEIICREYIKYIKRYMFNQNKKEKRNDSRNDADTD